MTAAVETPLRHYIKRRAKRLDWSVATYSGAILEMWMKQGFPNVSPLESALPALPFLAKDEFDPDEVPAS